MTAGASCASAQLASLQRSRAQYISPISLRKQVVAVCKFNRAVVLGRRRVVQSNAHAGRHDAVHLTPPEQRPLAPRPLPLSPSAVGLLHVLKYSFQICLTERWALPRLAAVFGLLFISRMAGFTMPLYFKRAVEAAGRGAAGRQMLLRALVMAGICRLVSGVCRDLQSPVFTLIAQAAGRRMSYHGLQHVLSLGPNFHSGASTGALTRIIDRGTKSISAMCRAVVFRLVPTSFELIAVCSVLTKLFHPAVGCVVAATTFLYTGFTAYMTQAAVNRKQQLKQYDNAINGRTVELLINHETIALLGRQKQEAASFGVLLKGYQDAAIGVEYVTGFLTACQAVILGVGLTSALVIVASQSSSAGDLVLVQGMLLQLWAPLVSIGGLYRRLRRSLVDLEDFIAVLRLQPEATEGSHQLASVPQQHKPECSSRQHSATRTAVAKQRGCSTATTANRYETDQPAPVLHHTANPPRQSHQASKLKVHMQSARGHSQDAGNADTSVLPSASQPSVTQGPERLITTHPGTSERSRQGSDPAAAPSKVLRPLDACNHGIASSSSSISVSISDNSSRHGSSNGSSTDSRAMDGREGAVSPAKGIQGLQLEFRDVSFGYAGAGQQLRNVCFTIEPGACVGIVGPPGSGKSTLLRLIMRLYDVDAGAVLLDGVDVRRLTFASLRGAVAAVPQQVNLVNGSVADNIAFGCPEADAGRLVEAASLACLDGAIATMPRGYATEVGERGVKVSGGERQRIAIARALIRQPRLLLCDEATSALDQGAEGTVLASVLDAVRKGRTTIIVAHKLKTVAGCDKVIVLENGMISDSGSPQELRTRHGWYSRTWAAQQQQHGLRDTRNETS